MLQLDCVPCSISLDDAITVTLREMRRRGLGETHRVAAVHGAPDATAEGAMFAATIFPRADAVRSLARGHGGRLKFLIASDGQLSVRPWRAHGVAAEADEQD